MGRAWTVAERPVVTGSNVRARWGTWPAASSRRCNIMMVEGPGEGMWGNALSLPVSTWYLNCYFIRQREGDGSGQKRAGSKAEFLTWQPRGSCKSHG